MPSCRGFRIGLLVNPIAGMGGAVGLKGTDGLAEEASRRGARPIAPDRARSCLLRLAEGASGLDLLCPSGLMGEEEIRGILPYEVVYTAPDQTSAEDTRAACRAFLEEGVGLVLFCGGDGTARDVASSVCGTPILGIPAGVKMHSGVFAVSPEAAAELALGYARGELCTRETEIVDIDEDLCRRGELSTRIYSTAKTPYRPALVQDRKRIYASRDEDEFRDQIALFAREFMQDGSAYILGAGTTTARIAELMGLEKTLLGVDVVKDGRLMLRDASERDLLGALEKERSVRIIVSPVGAQGFILGRGSQQIGASLLRRVGPEGLIIVSTPHKLRELPYLLVDTGDPDVDRALSGRRLVVTGYRMAQRKDVRPASDLG